MQAAFVNYGKQRGTVSLAFNDIQSDYYQIPHDDKYRLKKEEENLRFQLKEKSKNVEENEKITRSGKISNINPSNSNLDENLNSNLDAN